MQIVHLYFVQISRKFSSRIALRTVVVVSPEVLIYFSELNEHNNSQWWNVINLRSDSVLFYLFVSLFFIIYMRLIRFAVSFFATTIHGKLFFTAINNFLSLFCFGCSSLCFFFFAWLSLVLFFLFSFYPHAVYTNAPRKYVIFIVYCCYLENSPPH